jgi:peptidylprolyl isomerase
VAGTGARLARGDRVRMHYVAVNGRTGQELESSYGAAPAVMALDPKRSVRGLVTAMVGTPVGSRVLVALAPKEGVTRSLEAQGVKRNDTLLFVLDVVGVVPSRASGEAVAPVPGLPTVALAASGKPSITTPGTPPPSELVVQPLVRGAGPVVAAGQTITVHYTGVVWGGRQFDSSWDDGEPAAFPIGAGRVIKGWDAGLVGQTVGSQVLLVVPPDQGYGASGNSAAGIGGTDTLVFVVDILDAG